MSRFTVQEFVNMAFEGVSFQVPESIKKMLKELESCLEITDSIPETGGQGSGQGTSMVHRRSTNPRFGSDTSYTDFAHRKRDTREGREGREGRGKKDYYGGGGGGDWNDGKAKKSASSNDAEWETMRSFKATKIESKTGIEKTVNDIRIALNKMSDKNYDKQQSAVLALVADHFNGSESEEDTRRISRAIFDIASTNKLNSGIYANLYKSLVDLNIVFRTLLDEFVSGVTNMDGFPIYVDPDTDYDGFCVYSKACDRKKATSTFLVHCLKVDLIDPSQIAQILGEFLEYVETHIESDGFSKLVEEVIENVFVITTLCGKSVTSRKNNWKPVVERLAARRSDGLPSFSNRAAFKCMDILEQI